MCHLISGLRTRMTELICGNHNPYTAVIHHCCSRHFRRYLLTLHNSESPVVWSLQFRDYGIWYYGIDFTANERYPLVFNPLIRWRRRSSSYVMWHMNFTQFWGLSVPKLQWLRPMVTHLVQFGYLLCVLDWGSFLIGGFLFALIKLNFLSRLYRYHLF